jgi:hypothetical protein
MSTLSTPSRKPTKKALQTEIKKFAESKWKELWQAGDKSGTAPHLRRIAKDNLTQGWELYRSMPQRKACATLIQLRTGHCVLNNYLFRFKKVDSAECPQCGHANETVEHFLLECPHYWEERQVLRDEVGTRSMTLSGLLGDKKIVNATLQYVATTGCFNEEEMMWRQDRRIADRRDGTEDSVNNDTNRQH